jgi:hypothetical protein
MKWVLHTSIEFGQDGRVNRFYEALRTLQQDMKFVRKLAHECELFHAACGLTRGRPDRGMNGAGPEAQRVAAAPALFLFLRHLVLRHELLLRLHRHLRIVTELY